MKRMKTSEMRRVQLCLFCPTGCKIASLNSRKQAGGGGRGVAWVWCQCFCTVWGAASLKIQGKKTKLFTPEVGADCGRCQTECLRREVTDSGEPIRTCAPFCLLSGDSRLRARAAFRENHGNKSRRSANMDEVWQGNNGPNCRERAQLFGKPTQWRPQRWPRNHRKLSSIVWAEWFWRVVKLASFPALVLS